MRRFLPFIVCGMLSAGCVATELSPSLGAYLNEPPPSPDPAPVTAFLFTLHESHDGRDDCFACEGLASGDAQAAIRIWDRLKGKYPFLKNVKDGPTDLDPLPKPLAPQGPSARYSVPIRSEKPEYSWKDRSTSMATILSLKPSYFLHIHTEIVIEGGEQSGAAILLAGIVPGRVEKYYTVKALLTLPDGKTVVAKGESAATVTLTMWLPYIFTAPFTSPSLKEWDAFYEQPYVDVLNQLSNEYKEYLEKTQPRPPAPEPAATPAVPTVR